MRWDNKRLYAIVDTSYVIPSELLAVTQELCEGGVDVLQFRDKMLSDKDRCNFCLKIKEITATFDIPFIVNDRFDIALAVDADGVHLGQDDVPITVARRILHDMGRNMIIGASTHSMQQALDADALDIDYLATGPLFPTPTKPDYIPVGVPVASEVFRTVKHPVFGIGGVNIDTINEVVSAGINRVVIVSALLCAPDRKKIICDIKNILK
ncbi:MAG: thiamine phosphate synthase [Candidatus Auribacterota bacterium]